MRLLECARLRIKDIDFGYSQVEKTSGGDMAKCSCLIR